MHHAKNDFTLSLIFQTCLGSATVIERFWERKEKDNGIW